MYTLEEQRGSVDCCLLSTYWGKGIVRRRWKKWAPTNTEDGWLVFDWEGQEPTREEASFKIGLVLDLYEGTLDVYKNDRRLGTMKTGLVGEYCWVVTLASSFSDAQVSVTIGR